MTLPYEIFFCEILPHVKWTELNYLEKCCNCDNFFNNHLITELHRRIYMFEELYDFTISYDENIFENLDDYVVDKYMCEEYFWDDRDEIYF